MYHVDYKVTIMVDYKVFDGMIILSDYVLGIVRFSSNELLVNVVDVSAMSLAKTFVDYKV